MASINKNPPSSAPSVLVQRSGADCVRENVYRWDGGGKDSWTFTSRKAPILNTNELFGLKRELGAYQGQSLPEALYGHNSLDMVHEASGIRISFSALEALRAWASLDHPAVRVAHAWEDTATRQHQIATTSPSMRFVRYDYDYTFTTPYPGSTVVIVARNDDGGDGGGGGGSTDGQAANSEEDRKDADAVKEGIASGAVAPRTSTQPDTSSFLGRPATDLACGTAKLRKPLCKCRGTGGRVPLVVGGGSSTDAKTVRAATVKITVGRGMSSGIGSASKGGAASTGTGSGSGGGAGHVVAVSDPALIPPSWTEITEKSTEGGARGEGLNVRSLLASDPNPPLFTDTVELYEDDLHECGLTFLRAKVYVARQFWVVFIRCFVRVDGVMARVLDTRYVYHRGDSRVCRERSWREGSWADLIHGSSTDGGYVRAVPRAVPRGVPTMRRGLQTVRPIFSGRQHGTPPPMGSVPVVASLDQINDHVAAKVLPCISPCVVESLALLLPPGEAEKREADDGGVVLPIWTQSAAVDVMCPGNGYGIAAYIVTGDGTRVEALSTLTGSTVWVVEFDNEDDDRDEVKVENPQCHRGRRGRRRANVLSMMVSPSTEDDAIALGDDAGSIHVWKASTGQRLWSFPVTATTITTSSSCGSVAQSRRASNVSSSSKWVDRVQWSTDGLILAGAAGRSAIMADRRGSLEWGGASLARMVSGAGTVTGIAFHAEGRALAVGSYGVVNWLVGSKGEGEAGVEVGSCEDGHCSVDDAGRGQCDAAPVVAARVSGAATTACTTATPSGPLERGASAVLCVSVSPDGSKVAIGCLDKTVRVFHLVGPKSGTAVDWTGFDGAVSAVRFSANGRWLGAVGGTALLVVPAGLRLGFEAPILCRTRGVPVADGGAATTCGRFSDLAWSPLPGQAQRVHVMGRADSCCGAKLSSSNATWEHLLAAVEPRRGRAHLFDVNQTDDAVPRCALPILTVEPPGSGPNTSIAFMRGECGAEAGDQRIDQGIGSNAQTPILVVARGGKVVAVQVP